MNKNKDCIFTIGEKVFDCNYCICKVVGIIKIPNASDDPKLDWIYYTEDGEGALWSCSYEDLRKLDKNTIPKNGKDNEDRN